MKISYNWLQEFIDIDLSPEDLENTLTLIGLEVEEYEEYGVSFENVVVGEILEVKNHPNADRLKICMVNNGEETVQIVCGADNVAKSQKVVVAKVGSTLPIKLEDGNLLTLKKAKLRGEESHGMICAEDELGLGDDHSGIMVLDGDLVPGTPITDVLDLYNDLIFDIAITPNRPDATCHLGVARDLSAKLGLELVKPKVDYTPDVKNTNEFDIEIESKNCSRYAGILIKDVKVESSPNWLKNKLKAIGLRSVNNIVDITNYVMYEIGQPLHAFDFDLLSGGKIVVKDFDKEVEFETLDHVKRKCEAGTLFICDAEKPVAIAGIMGGLYSEVSDSTTNILIESAYFDPGRIRSTSKKQALQTDASYRFERGIDPNLQKFAAERTAQLILEVAGGKVSETKDVHPIKTEARELTLRMSYLNKLLGTNFDVKETKEILDGLELEVISTQKDSITYKIPTFRPDLEREVDLIEEVGRLFDYNEITSPNNGIFVSSEPLTDWEVLVSKSKETAVQLSYKEIYANSLISQIEAERFEDSKNLIVTLNPLNKEMSTMRPSLLHGFLKATDYNFNRKAETIRFFEVGNVFVQSKDYSYHKGIKEQTHILFGISGKRNSEHWSKKAESFKGIDLKSDCDAFFRKLGLREIKTSLNDNKELFFVFEDIELGKLAEVSTALLKAYDISEPTFYAEFNINSISKALAKTEVSKFVPVPKFPSFEFDFAVIVDQKVTAGDLLDTIKQKAGNNLINIDIFDVFEGESIGNNNKSIAFRLNFSDSNKTLNIKEVEPIIKRVVNSLEKEFSAKLRS